MAEHVVVVEHDDTVESVADLSLLAFDVKYDVVFVILVGGRSGCAGIDRIEPVVGDTQKLATECIGVVTLMASRMQAAGLGRGVLGCGAEGSRLCWAYQVVIFRRGQVLEVVANVCVGTGIGDQNRVILFDSRCQGSKITFAQVWSGLSVATAR